MSKTEKEIQDERHEHGRVEPEMPDYSTGPNEYRGTNEADVINEQLQQHDHVPEVKRPGDDPNMTALQIEKAEEVRKQNAANATETADNFAQGDLDRERPLAPKSKTSKK